MIKSDYGKILSIISERVGHIKDVKNESEMDEAYKDVFSTKEQKDRDKKVTQLLSLYVDEYEYHNKSNHYYKGIFIAICGLILIGFATLFCIILWNCVFSKDTRAKSDVIELISVCITFLTLIVGIAKIIVKYIFPENEQEYITRIVELIQKNDLQNKKEHIKAYKIGSLKKASDETISINLLDKENNQE